MKKLFLLFVIVGLITFRVNGQIEKQNSYSAGSSKLEVAISKSVIHAHAFLADTTQILDCYVLIDYLNRQYGGMLWVLDRDQAMRRIKETYKNNDDEWYYFLRLADKDAHCPSWQDIQKIKSPIDSMTLQALWSDKLQPVKITIIKSLLECLKWATIN